MDRDLCVSFMMLVGASSSLEGSIRQQAARCGLKPKELVWTVDGESRKRALITPNGDLDSFPFSSLNCMLDWAQRTGAPVGFISARPPKIGS
ncbi:MULTISPECIES: hypothetical protein [Sphingomonas]|uniref:hypothetical protein n=1 Tax=Sphingomonas TaxID=13687 RepID=UPI00126A1194|nr:MULTISPECIES: hypothetical protein [Sphingomonas]